MELLSVIKRHNINSFELPFRTWEDWQEKGGAEVVCLLCDWSADTSERLLRHMKVRA